MKMKILLWISVFLLTATLFMIKDEGSIAGITDKMFSKKAYIRASIR